MASTIDRSLAGTWHNDEGSRLTLVVAETGELSGHFRPGVGFGLDEDFPVTGFTAGSLIAFVVSFGRFDSITSWVGHLLEDDGPVLRTLWHMTLEQPHRGRRDEQWKTLWSGANVFRREAGEERRRRSRLAGPPFPLWSS